MRISTGESGVLRAIREAERADPSPGPFRIHRLPSWVPIGWAELPSTRRLRELVDWEIDTLQPGFGLMHGVAYVFTDESDTGRSDYRRLFRPTFLAADPPMAAALGVEPGRRVLYLSQGGVRPLGRPLLHHPGLPRQLDPGQSQLRRVSRRDRSDLPRHVRDGRPGTDPGSPGMAPDQGRAGPPEPEGIPRAWVVHHARVVHDGRLIHSDDNPEPAPHDALIARIRSGDPSADDLRTTAYIETDDPAELRLHLAAGGAAARPTPTESVTVRYDTPTRVVIEARLGRPGIVVLADAYDSGWRLTIDGRPATVHRANLLMRAAAVPAGPHTLVYTYKPALVGIGACDLPGRPGGHRRPDLLGSPPGSFARRGAD